eukprot:TRINITY_DN15899_c0_g1_i1.p1 TRINITY_DN15899_c0_g1~~TRINITY_DN15899_c0_g1_i1.p1  ORF type:complete len:308 (+),score=50.83 TRINITY_DN15899_c0_g1_i1:81-926(+)
MGCCESADKPQHARHPPERPPREAPRSRVPGGGSPPGDASLRSDEDGMQPSPMSGRPEPHYMLDKLIQSVANAPPREQSMKKGQGHEGWRLKERRLYTWRVLLTGPEESGKTHLLYSLINGPEHPEPAETDDARDETIFVTRGGGGKPRINFHTVDLGGRPAVREKYGQSAARNCAAIILVVDSSQPGKFAEAQQWLGQVRPMALSDAPVLVLAHKQDREDAQHPEEVGKAIGVTEGRDMHVCGSSYTDDGMLQCAAGLHWLADTLAEKWMNRASTRGGKA